MRVTTAMSESRLSFEAMYAAITGRDTRFDGTFYTAVRTTGVYCRPSCPARKPHRHNVTFYPSAAAAQTAGYRACRRCIPEALPGSPLWDVPGSLAARALQLIDRGLVDEEGVEGLARRLGWSSRTITRTLLEQTGAAPLAHARARRARLAHALITRTGEAFSDIAFAAGFASIRQFNDTVRAVYGVNPTQLRAHQARSGSPVRTATGSAAGSTAARGLAGAAGTNAGTLRAALTYRAPLDWTGLLSWFARRAMPAVESVTGDRYRLALTLPHGTGVTTLRLDAARERIDVDLDLSDLRDYGPACATLRRIFDLEADPVGIDERLASITSLSLLVQRVPGIRIPGTPTPLEALLRALTGRQGSVTAGLSNLRRLLPETDDDELRPFPDATEILDRGMDWYRGPAARRDTIIVGLELAAGGGLDPAGDPGEVMDALASITGIEPWTIAYTLLRGYGSPDVDLSGDRALANAVHLLTGRRDVAAFLAAATPWRSYASLHLWQQAPAPRSSARPSSSS